MPRKAGECKLSNAGLLTSRCSGRAGLALNGDVMCVEAGSEAAGCESFDNEPGCYEAECPGCDCFRPVGDLGLCAECSAMCERDLIRMRDWEYSTLAYGLTPAERERLRRTVMEKHGQRNELLDPGAARIDNGKRRNRPRI